MSDHKNKITKLLWVDLEMTGLDVDKEVIIEVAAIITDMNFVPIAPAYHSIVKQDQSYIDNMDEWNTEHHGNSGLVAKIPTGKDSHLVENELIEIIDEYFDGELAVLAGNSISQDRKFIDRHWPNLAKKLHYRLLDVTSWKLIFENKYDINHAKKDAHRATDDILESIEELKTYIKYIKP